MTREYDWDNLIKQLTVSTSPRLDVRIEALIEQSKSSVGSRSIGQDFFTHVHRHMMKYAAAVILVTVGLLSWNIHQSSRPDFYTIHQTVEAFTEVHTVQMPVPNSSRGSEILMSINPQTGRADFLRMDNPDTGDVTITVPGQTYACNSQTNEVTLLGQELLFVDLNFKNLFSSIVKGKHAVGGRIEILRAFSELAGEEVIIVNILRKNQTLAGKLLIDPKTRLPIYIGIDAGGHLSYMGPIQYNVGIQKDTFEFVIPDDADVIDLRSEEQKNTDIERPAPPVESSKKVTPYGRHGRVSFEEEE